MILDPEDIIFCRIATRVGPKYQSNIPDIGTQPAGPDDERGEEKTVEVLSALQDFMNAECKRFSSDLEVIVEKSFLSS